MVHDECHSVDKRVCMAYGVHYSTDEHMGGGVTHAAGLIVTGNCPHQMTEPYPWHTTRVGALTQTVFVPATYTPGQL